MLTDVGGGSDLLARLDQEGSLLPETSISVGIQCILSNGKKRILQIPYDNSYVMVYIMANCFRR